LAVAPLEVQVGKRYRFRFICITPAPGLEVTLADGDHAETWRAIAKDGATLPPAQAVHQTAKFQINPGETYDFEFEPTSPGSLRLTALQRSFKLQAVVLIVVRPR
jgi:FtsP/CotA-like multicopper oxidase with cupredoxin domain